MKAHEAISEGLLLLSAAILAAMLPQPAAIKTLVVSVPKAAPVVVAPAATFVTPVAPVLQVTEPVRKTRIEAKPYDHVRTIKVSLPDRRLALIEDGRVKRIYTVAVGKASTPSPTGTFTIVARVTNPTYYHEGKVVPPGPANPVGDRWMGLSKAGFGIHGTNAPRSIGKAASHGCIRMAQPDLEQLFAQVRTGDTVEISASALRTPQRCSKRRRRPRVPRRLWPGMLLDPTRRLPPPFRPASNEALLLYGGSHGTVC